MTLEQERVEEPARALDGYQSVRADLRAEREAIVRLLSTNLGIKGDLSATFRWQYLEGPMAPGEIFLLRTGDQIVGCTALARRELWSGARPIRAMQNANFVVDRAHRTARPAIALQRAAKHHIEETCDLGFGFPNAAARAVYRHIGYHTLGDLPRYVRVLRHGGYVERLLGERGWPRRAGKLVGGSSGVVFDTARRTFDSVRAGRAGRRSSLIWLADVDARFDQLWQEASAERAIVCVRNAAFLRWRFLRKPDEHHALAALVDHGSDRLKAYAFVRSAPSGIAEITDLFGGFEALDDLLVMLAPELDRRGHIAMSCLFAGDPRILAMLAAHGFRRRDSRRTAMVFGAPSCHVPAATLRDPASWYFTELDADT
ncbi:MAG: hypothetical protein ACTHU0_35785 [Kofleriaceae bacterium]